MSTQFAPRPSAVPAVTNAALLERRAAAVPRGVGHATSIFAAHAENAELWDVEGRRYIDFAGGIGVLNSGHRHPRVVAAVQAQLEHYMHTAFQIVMYEPYIALAERLNALAPVAQPAKTLFLSTGAEACENAIKIARAATRRTAVIAFSGAFHGRTLLGMAMTGKVLPYKHEFGPMPAEIFHVPFPIEHYGVSVADSLRALDHVFKADVSPVNVAAIIIEPVQGEGGFHAAPPELLRAVRTLCDTHGIVLIADEVQSGFGRTGKMFAVEHSGVMPDLITMAKSLAGGLPLAAVTGNGKIMDAVSPGGLGGTYAGNPLACAAALAVLDVFEHEHLLDRSVALGERMRQRLAKLESRSDLAPIAALRGLGSMVAFDVVKSAGGHEPDAEGAKRVTSRALERGLILITCGVYANSIRILVPMSASDELIDEGLRIIEESLRK